MQLPKALLFALFLLGCCTQPGLGQASLSDYRMVERMDELYTSGQFETLLKRADRWKDRKWGDTPDSWVFSYYKAKAYLGLARQSEGRTRARHLNKGTSLLRTVRRKNREGNWVDLDPEFNVATHQLLEDEANSALLAMNTTRGYQFLRTIAELYNDTTLTYRALENEEDLVSYSISKRESDTEIFPFVFVKAINKLRAEGCQCGSNYYPPVGPISWDATLAKTAELHSIDMDTNNYFDHTGRDGSKPWDRAERQGFESRMVGENIAMGYHAELATFRGWVNSPGHCANMMKEGFSKIGLGRSGTYWTLLLAK